MLPLYAALVKGLFAEEGLTVQGLPVDTRGAIEQGKTNWLHVKTDKGLTEADFGFIDVDQLHYMAAGKIGHYIVDGMNFGCMDIMVPADSTLTSAADLKGKTVEINPWWIEPFRIQRGLTFVNSELKTSGVDAQKDVTLRPMPWEALPRIADYVGDGFKAGRFQAVGVTEPQQTILKERKIAKVLFSQTYQAPHNQEYCCFFGIKRELVDRHPDKAAAIVRAFRRAKLWVAENPARAVITTQAAGYFPASVPVQPSANTVSALGFDRKVDVGANLERAFKDRIEAGLIKTGKSAADLVRLHYRKFD
ncbi:MAG TPA: ABC transporter substrate-binding protein [Methylomirabilota bacterium]|nr:ABC transporter substrate-binding protein [Methylomirabilota bacterium]